MSDWCVANAEITAYHACYACHACCPMSIVCTQNYIFVYLSYILSYFEVQLVSYRHKIMFL